jgi:hypothetical protein
MTLARSSIAFTALLDRLLIKDKSEHRSVLCHHAIEIAIYPDAIWLTARILRARRTSHRNAP